VPGKKKSKVDVSALQDQVSDLANQVSVLMDRSGTARLTALVRNGRYLARDAGVRVGPVVAGLLATASPQVQLARKVAAPYLDQARDRASGVARDVAPVLVNARGRVVDELSPKVVEALAAAGPYRAEAVRRGTAAVAALRGEIEVPPKTHRVRTTLILVGVAGAGYAAYRYLTGESSTSGWQTPSTTSAPTTGPATADRAYTSDAATAAAAADEPAADATATVDKLAADAEIVQDDGGSPESRPRA